MPRLVEQELDQGETTAEIPFIDGLSQEVRRIARTAGVRRAFFAPSTTRPLYSVKGKLPHDLTTNAIYSIKCKTCDEEYVGALSIPSVPLNCTRGQVNALFGNLVCALVN